MDLGKMIQQAAREKTTGGTRVVGGEELVELRKTMVHIPALKPGDKVRFKGRGFKYSKFPAFDEVVEVFNVFPKCELVTHVEQRIENDFSILTIDGDGDFFEHAYDSRFFERAV